MMYNELTRLHFETAAHAGELSVGPARRDATATLRRGTAGQRATGTWVQFDVRIESRGGVQSVADARFLAFGCPHVVAIADWLAAQAVGRAAVPELPESVHALARRFAVPVAKLGRLLVVEDAWNAAFSTPNRR